MMIFPSDNITTMIGKLELNKLIKEKESIDKEMKTAGLIRRIQLSNKSLKLSKKIVELELGKNN